MVHKVFPQNQEPVAQCVQQQSVALFVTSLVLESLIVEWVRVMSIDNIIRLPLRLVADFVGRRVLEDRRVQEELSVRRSMSCPWISNVSDSRLHKRLKLLDCVWKFAPVFLLDCKTRDHVGGWLRGLFQERDQRRTRKVVQFRGWHKIGVNHIDIIGCGGLDANVAEVVDGVS